MCILRPTFTGAYGVHATTLASPGISQEPLHPAQQLVQGTPNSSGWQSAKYVLTTMMDT